MLLRKDGSPVRGLSNQVVTTEVMGKPELFCIDMPLDGEFNITKIAPK